MTMYADLLSRALDRSPSPSAARPDDALWADLVNSWAQLLAYEIRGTPSAPEALARELSYDGALIRFCEALDVPTAAERFANPSEERARLEQALAARGFSVGTR